MNIHLDNKKTPPQFCEQFSEHRLHCIHKLVAESWADIPLPPEAWFALNPPNPWA